QFENMPGLANCGRCGASLLIGQADIDVHPPRASTRRKQLRRRFPSVHGFRERVHTLGTALVKGVSHNEQPPEWPVVWRMIIPGWAHRYSGYHIRAMIFFFSYLALLLSGLYFIGTNRGGLLLGLAFSCHASSILDLTILYYHSLRD